MNSPSSNETPYDKNITAKLLNDLHPNHVLLKVIGEIETLKDHGRSCVIVAHGFLELLVNILVRNKCKNAVRIISSTRDFPHSTKLILLHELGCLSDSDIRMLNWFRKLRNRAAHDPHFRITENDLRSFGSGPFGNPAQFHVLCLSVFGTLWNRHYELFSAEFFPSAYGNRTEPRHDV